MTEPLTNILIRFKTDGDSSKKMYYKKRKKYSNFLGFSRVVCHVVYINKITKIK